MYGIVDMMEFEGSRTEPAKHPAINKYMHKHSSVWKKLYFKQLENKQTIPEGLITDRGDQKNVWDCKERCKD